MNQHDQNDQAVTKEEFDAFRASYPSLLKTEVSHSSEPPLLTLNDSSGGKVWPESVVAYAHLNEGSGVPNTYYIREAAKGGV